MAKTKSKKTIKKISTPMPKAKKAVKVIKKMRTSPAVVSVTQKKGLNTILMIKLLLVIAVGVVVFLLVQKNINLFVAGTVNKSPVTRWELNNKMGEKYAEQTFEEIVSERLLAENLKKYNIVVSEKEVQDELAKIKLQYGGEEQFQAALAQFGTTEAKALYSIEQSIGLKKLIETVSKIEISEESVSLYYTENKATYDGKTFEEVKEQIKEALYQQEIYTKSQEWYSTIRKEATVNSFI